MRKAVILIFAVIAIFVFFVASLPCFAAKKSNTQVIYPVDDDGVINGCYKKVNGQLRVIDSTDFCGPSEGSISWNQAGQSGMIDLGNTYVKTCPSPNAGVCFCDDGWVLQGYAECPTGTVLTSMGTPIDAADYGFHAICVTLDGSVTTVDPLSISIRCVGTPQENNCSDGVDNDVDGAIDCSDADCATDPACSPMETNCSDGIDNDGDTAIDCDDSDCSIDPACLPIETDCSDGIDNDGDTTIDCDDSDCSTDPACLPGLVPVPVETNCSDGQDNDGNGKIDCKDKNCKNDPNCTKKKAP